MTQKSTSYNNQQLEQLLSSIGNSRDAHNHGYNTQINNNNNTILWLLTINIDTEVTHCNIVQHSCNERTTTVDAESPISRILPKTRLSTLVNDRLLLSSLPYLDSSGGPIQS